MGDPDYAEIARLEREMGMAQDQLDNETEWDILLAEFGIDDEEDT